MTEKEKNFYRGVSVVLVELISIYSLPDLAIQIMKDRNISISDFERAQISSINFSILKKVFNE